MDILQCFRYAIIVTKRVTLGYINIKFNIFNNLKRFYINMVIVIYDNPTNHTFYQVV